ncbi:hypothetical protein Tco_0926533 [Tanacetum coccineum]|uniref:Uncharacterized protein n=1 Tax=Tanacetum coccineum TaxID=301880 RepID=A0ABQ5DH19_9ASTR
MTLLISGRVTVNAARVNRPVLSNQTSQVHTEAYEHRGILDSGCSGAPMTDAEELLVVSSTFLNSRLDPEHNATKEHQGPVPTKTPTSTNPVNTGSSDFNTGDEQVSPGHIEAVAPSAHNVEEVFSDDDDDEMPEIRIYDKSSEVFKKNLLKFKLQQVWVLGLTFTQCAKVIAELEAVYQVVLAFASFMGFIFYSRWMLKSFLYGTMMRRFMVSQPPGFVDPDQSYKRFLYKLVRRVMACTSS